MSNQPPTHSYSISSHVTQAPPSAPSHALRPPLSVPVPAPSPPGPDNPPCLRPAQTLLWGSLLSVSILLPSPSPGSFSLRSLVLRSGESTQVSPESRDWSRHQRLRRPQGGKKERFPREVLSAPSSVRKRDGGWSMDGRVKSRRAAPRGSSTPAGQEQGPEPSNDTERTWSLMDMERLSLHERLASNSSARKAGGGGSEGGGEEAEDESMSGVTQSLVTGGKRRASFRGFVKKIRRSFSKVTERLRD